MVPTSRNPRAGALQQLGQPEAVADLDQLASADDDLAAGRQRGGREHERGRVVVDHMHGLRVRHGPGQCRQHRRAAAAAGARGQVELNDRCIPRRR